MESSSKTDVFTGIEASTPHGLSVILSFVLGLEYNMYILYHTTDFDEETADDKDIDMGIYYGHMYSEGKVVIDLHRVNFD